MSLDLGFAIFLVVCIVALIWSARDKVTHDPEPGKVTGFDLRIELRDPVDPEHAAQWAQATIDHLVETFNDDNSIRYITYDVPNPEMPE